MSPIVTFAVLTATADDVARDFEGALPMGTAVPVTDRELGVLAAGLPD